MIDTIITPDEDDEIEESGEDEWVHAPGTDTETQIWVYRWAVPNLKKMREQAEKTVAKDKPDPTDRDYHYAHPKREQRRIARSEEEIQRDVDGMVDFQVAGFSVNAMKHANSWGPAIIAMLMESGLLRPTQSPIDAIENLIGSISKNKLAMLKLGFSAKKPVKKGKKK